MNAFGFSSLPGGRFFRDVDVRRDPWGSFVTDMFGCPFGAGELCRVESGRQRAFLLGPGNRPRLDGKPDGGGRNDQRNADISANLFLLERNGCDERFGIQHRQRVQLGIFLERLVMRREFVVFRGVVSMLRRNRDLVVFPLGNVLRGLWWMNPIANRHLRSWK